MPIRNPFGEPSGAGSSRRTIIAENSTMSAASACGAPSSAECSTVLATRWRVSALQLAAMTWPGRAHPRHASAIRYPGHPLGMISSARSSWRSALAGQVGWPTAPPRLGRLSRAPHPTASHRAGSGRVNWLRPFAIASSTGMAPSPALRRAVPSWRRSPCRCPRWRAAGVAPHP
jgi:hypothetical protein